MPAGGVGRRHYPDDGSTTCAQPDGGLSIFRRTSHWPQLWSRGLTVRWTAHDKCPADFLPGGWRQAQPGCSACSTHLFKGLSSSNPQCEIRSRARPYTYRHERTQARGARPGVFRAGMAGSIVTGAPCMGCARRGDRVHPVLSAGSPAHPRSHCVAPEVPLGRGVGTTQEFERLDTFDGITPATLH